MYCIPYSYNKVSKRQENVIKNFIRKKTYICSIYWKKNPRISGPVQFKACCSGSTVFWCHYSLLLPRGYLYLGVGCTFPHAKCLWTNEKEALPFLWLFCSSFLV